MVIVDELDSLMAFVLINFKNKVIMDKVDILMKFIFTKLIYFDIW